jgi:hypothetical protein
MSEDQASGSAKKSNPTPVHRSFCLQGPAHMLRPTGTASKDLAKQVLLETQQGNTDDAIKEEFDFDELAEYGDVEGELSDGEVCWCRTVRLRAHRVQLEKLIETCE